jgi:ABC-type lipoprotein export system ATPase subunit
MSDFSIVEAHGIGKEFPNMTAPVLDEVNLTIESGEIVALRGPSGSGKSTLLNIIGCLDGPTRGSYSLGGRDVSTLSARERAWVRLHYIGFIFQSFHLITDHTVIENVTLPLYYAGLGREEREARATELIERVGLGHRMNHRPAQLSGGEKQRVAIARSVATQPRLLLADEPTGALDTNTGNEVMDLLLEMHSARSFTLIIVTHDPDVAEFCHRQIFLRDGKIVTGGGRHAANA